MFVLSACDISDPKLFLACTGTIIKVQNLRKEWELFSAWFS